MFRHRPSVARAFLTLLVIAGVLGAGATFAGTNVGSINFTAGLKRLDNDWNLGYPILAADRQAVPAGAVSEPALGAELTWGRQGWPVSIALDVLHSYDDGIEHFPAFVLPAFDRRQRARTIEVGLGLRRAFLIKSLSPYIGAGGAWVRASTVVEAIDPNDGPAGTRFAQAGWNQTAVGFWAGGGLYYRLGPRVQIGASGRYSRAKLPETEVFGVTGGETVSLGKVREREAGGKHFALLVGWSFPGRP